MCNQEIKSMDRAFRPSAALPSYEAASSPRMRHSLEQAEIERRVAIYARQVEERDRLTWLPHRGEGQNA
ncbi:MAG: hypothetical protein WC869_14605 [Phycisphaerae bacterium]|jgi:hypothetical protein